MKIHLDEKADALYLRKRGSAESRTARELSPERGSGGRGLWSAVPVSWIAREAGLDAGTAFTSAPSRDNLATSNAAPPSDSRGGARHGRIQSGARAPPDTALQSSHPSTIRPPFQRTRGQTKGNESSPVNRLNGVRSIPRC